jgi:hypothetical protein
MSAAGARSAKRRRLWRNRSQPPGGRRGSASGRDERRNRVGREVVGLRWPLGPGLAAVGEEDADGQDYAEQQQPEWYQYYEREASRPGKRWRDRLRFEVSAQLRSTVKGRHANASSALAAKASSLGRRDQAFDTIRLSVSEVARVELVAHTRMHPEPAEAL